MAGDLLVGVARELGENESLSWAARQLTEGRHELAHDQAIFLDRRRGQHRLRVDGVHDPPLAPQLRDELIALDAEDPAAEVRVGTKRFAAGQRVQRRLLDQVLGAVAVARQRQGIDAQARQGVHPAGIERVDLRLGHRHGSLRSCR
jgi:hypothetical protein